MDLPVRWISLLLEANSLLLYYLVFTSRLPVFRSLKSHMNQWFLTGADFAPPAQRTFGNAWGHCWLLKLGGRVPYNWRETRGVSDVGGGGAASHVRLIAHYSSVCTVSRFFHQSCGLFKFNIKNFFNWRIIASQCCVDFLCTITGISHNYIYIYIPSLLHLPPHSRPTPLRGSQSSRLGSLVAASHSDPFHTW